MLDQLDLVHMNGRVYDPSIGRFVTADPLVSEPVDGQNYNRYSYVLNNPTNLTDPSGFAHATTADCTITDTCPSSKKPDCTKGCEEKDKNGNVIPYTENADGSVSIERRLLTSPKSQTGQMKANAKNLTDSGTSWYDNPGLTGSANSQRAAERRASYWGAFFGGDYSVMDSDGMAGHKHGENLGLAVDAGAVAAPFLKGLSWLRGLGVSSEAGSIRGVNAVGGTMNCINCVVATDATLAGRSASAMPGGPYRISVLEKLFNRQFSAPGPISNVTNALSKAGDGSRGIVFGSRGSEVGHVFNVVNQKGTVRYLDGQSGKAAVLDGYNSFQFLRTN